MFNHLFFIYSFIGFIYVAFIFYSSSCFGYWTTILDMLKNDTLKIFLTSLGSICAVITIAFLVFWIVWPIMVIMQVVFWMLHIATPEDFFTNKGDVEDDYDKPN